MDPLTYTPSDDESQALQWVVDAQNAKQKESFDQQKLRVPEASRTAYVPVTVAQYWAIQSQNILKSYKAQEVKAWADQNAHLFIAVKGLSTDKQDQIKAIIAAK